MHIDVKQGTLGSYLFGFLSSVLLTLMAYVLVDQHLLSKGWLIATIVLLGLVQVVIQLILFLYLGQEAKPKPKLLVFIFMSVIVLMIVAGTLWIMYDLNKRVMPSDNHHAKNSLVEF